MAADAPSNADLTAPRFDSLMEVVRLRRSVRTPADDAVQTYVSGVRRQAMYRGSETLEDF